MSDESCLNRSRTEGLLTTSRYDAAEVPTMRVSKHLTRIPLAMHERVAVIVIRYCSSDMWVGNSSRVVTNAATGATELFQFHGAAIVDAVLRAGMSEGCRASCTARQTTIWIWAARQSCASTVRPHDKLVPSRQGARQSLSGWFELILVLSTPVLVEYQIDVPFPVFFPFSEKKG